MSALLFVYGTLRSGGCEAHSILAGRAPFAGLATVRGRLFDLGTYPGVILDPDSGSVTGELYEISDPLLEALDEYEGCTDRTPQPHEYRRVLVETLRADGTAVTAWAYVLNRDPRHAREIESGDYLAYRATYRMTTT